MVESALQVVLLTEEGQPQGTAQKKDVHTDRTPLHLAFSCHVLDSSGLVLVTRRSLQKRTWPGVWTNSFCGHPQPGESMEAAIRRHAHTELGLRLKDIQVQLPDFRYRATDASGIVENEICPVFIAQADGTPSPNPAEVAELRWSAPEQVGGALRQTPWAFSPWLVEQAQLMKLYQAPTAEDSTAG